MLTDFTRDAMFATAWFGLMTLVWLGWSQEDSPRRGRIWLGAGSALGVLLVAGFGVATVVNWHSPTALDGRYGWFGILVGVELLLAGAGCGLLAARGQQRWMAWWVVVIVAAHFLPLAWLLSDPTIAALGACQLVALAVLVPRLRHSKRATSRTVGPVMGGSLLSYALSAAAVLGADAIG